MVSEQEMVIFLAKELFVRGLQRRHTTLDNTGTNGWCHFPCGHRATRCTGHVLLSNTKSGNKKATPQYSNFYKYIMRNPCQSVNLLWKWNVELHSSLRRDSLYQSICAVFVREGQLLHTFSRSLHVALSEGSTTRHLRKKSFPRSDKVSGIKCANPCVAAVNMHKRPWGYNGGAFLIRSIMQTANDQMSAWSVSKWLVVWLPEGGVASVRSFQVGSKRLCRTFFELGQRINQRTSQSQLES